MCGRIPGHRLPLPIDPVMVHSFLLGEYRRVLDERFRLSLPEDLAAPLTEGESECILAKERAGCLSLWTAQDWQQRLDEGIQLVRGKMEAGRLDGRIEEVQRLGRLLSTRHTRVRLAGRRRLLVPEGFRQFLAIEPGGEVMVVGAAVCVELWQPAAWSNCIEETIPEFRQLFESLSN